MSQFRLYSVQECLSRSLRGALIGCALLAMFSMVVFLSDGDVPVKGDPRWAFLIFEATYVMPSTIVVGALGGLAYRPSRIILHPRRILIGSCLALIGIAQFFFRPQIAIVRRGFPPRWELIPDIVSVFFCLLAICIVMRRRWA